VVKAIPWWAAVAAGTAPVLLIGGFFIAASIQPASYSPVRDTISELAAPGATDSWLMTSALAGVGVCYLIAALGLNPARPAGRFMLVAGGTGTLLIATFRQPEHGYSVPHELAVIVAASACCIWPFFASHRLHRALLLTRGPSAAATGVLLGLAAWYALDSRGALRGLSERCAAAAMALWLPAVVITSRRALGQGATNDTQPPATRSSLGSTGRITESSVLVQEPEVP
jgi:hypothetical membrane protein